MTNVNSAWALFNASTKAALSGKSVKEYLMTKENKTEQEADALIAAAKQQSDAERK